MRKQAKKAFWTDSHCHLAMEDFDDDRVETLLRAKEAGVGRMVVVGTNPEDWSAAAGVAGMSGFKSTAGLHPHEASRWNEELRESLDAALSAGTIVAAGEIGLDFHYDFSPRERQIEAFEAQCRMAVEKNLPVVVHSREAFLETRKLLAGFVPDIRGVIHCFTYGPPEVEAFLEMGFYVSFSGIATFPGAPLVRESARLVPPDRLLVETDAPYLAPVPFRGKRCEPAHVATVGEYLADFLGIGRNHLAERTSANAARLLNWPVENG